MNGYLVILSHGMDDFPMGLYAIEGEANDAAMALEWDAHNDHPFDRFATTPNVISVLTFVDGKPTESRIVRKHSREEAIA